MDDDDLRDEEQLKELIIIHPNNESLFLFSFLDLGKDPILDGKAPKGTNRKQ